MVLDQFCKFALTGRCQSVERALKANVVGPDGADTVRRRDLATVHKLLFTSVFATPCTLSIAFKPESVTTTAQCFDRPQGASRVEFLSQTCDQNLDDIAVAFFVVRIQMRCKLIF